MFEEFTPGAKAALAAARTEAADHGHSEVVMAHLLLAILAQGDGTLDTVLGTAIPVEVARERLRESIPPAPSAAEGSEEGGSKPARPAFATSLKRLLRELDTTSTQKGSPIGVPELALSLLEASNPLVDGTVRSAGADEVELAGALRDAIEKAGHARLNEESPALPEAPSTLGSRKQVRRPEGAAPLVRRRATSAPQGEPEKLLPVPAAELEGEREEIAAVPGAASEAERESVQVSDTRQSRQTTSNDRLEDGPRPLPPPRPLQVVSGPSRTGTPAASESLSEVASTLGRAIGVAALLGFVVYVRTSRRARRKAARVGRSKRVVVR